MSMLASCTQGRRGIVTIRYRYNQPAVVSEIIEGEAVIIHLDTGAYYSARHVSAVVWDLVGAGVTIQQIVPAVKARFDVDEATAGRDIRAFVQQLAREALIVERGELQPVERVLPHVEARKPYTAPALERFDDMKDLLLADPIHDVDAAGWPHRPKA